MNQSGVERQLDAILSSMEDFVYIFDRSGKFTYVNQALLNLWEKDLSEAVGKNFHDLGYPPELAEKHRRQIKTVLSTGKPVRDANHFTSHNGGSRLYEYIFTPVFGDDGEVEAVAGITRDTTEFKEVVEALQQSQKRYRSLFESVDQGVCILEIIFNEDEEPVDYKWIEVNPTFKEQTGLYNPMGKTARELVPDLDDFWVETYAKVAKTRESVRFEHPAPAMNRWFDVFAFPIEEAEKHRVALLFNNITTRKRRELNAVFLAELNADFANLSTSEEIMRVAGEKLRHHLGVSRISFAKVDENEEDTTVVYDNHQPNLPSGLGPFQLSEFMSPRFIDQLRAGKVVAIDDVTTDPRTSTNKNAYRAFNVGSQVHAPHLSDGRLKFMLAIYHRHPYSWRNDELDLIREVTANLWLRLERAEAEEALRDNEELLQMALSAAHMAAWERNVTTGRVFFSENAASLIGVPAGTRSIDASQIFEWIHLEDQEFLSQTHQNAIETQQEYTTQYRLVRPDNGELIWLEESGLAIDHPDGEVHLVGMIRDITARKKEQRQLAQLTAEAQRKQRLHEAIMASTLDLAYVFDLDHRFIYANEALLEMWDRSWEESKGKSLIELGYEPWHAEMHEREIDTVVATKQPIRGEVPFHNAKEGRRIYDYIFVPVINDLGEVEAVVGTTRDVTDLKENEEALREADRRKNHFIGVLSHELRNPLAPIELSLYLLDQTETDSETTREARAVIKRQVDHLTRLVDDLLDVTRITNDKIRLQREHLDLNELINDTVEDHRAIFDKRELCLRFHRPEEPTSVDGDPNRLAQVIGNLLQNAAKFTAPHGRSDLRISQDSMTGMAHISITDTGVGLAPETIENLFDPFMQADTSIDHSNGGLGLGLTLVKGLTELHGGEVSVHSDGLGKGTEFIVSLPLAETQPTKAPAPVKKLTSHSRRVLLIEDNVDVARAMSVVLETKGHEVEIANDGSSGIEKARTWSPDVLICDIGLPEMSGYDVATAIRESNDLRSLRLIALSGYARPEDIEKSRRAGFDHHIAKPPDLKALDRLLLDASSDRRRSSSI